MSELPWFKFNPSEWLSGDIQFCSDAAQLLFINACSLYWKNDCQLTVKVLSKRCQYRAEKCKKCVKELQDENIICVKDDNISIDFLDEQYAQRKYISKVNSKNAKGDGSTVAKRSLNGRSNSVGHKEKEEEKETESEREQEDLFAPSTEPIEIDPANEWHAIKSQAWVSRLKKLNCKIGPNSWQTWNRICDDYDPDLIAKASEQVSPPDRFADNIEAEIIKLQETQNVSSDEFRF